MFNEDLWIWVHIEIERELKWLYVNDGETKAIQYIIVCSVKRQLNKGCLAM